MSLRKERIHACGVSNIDFRSKRETDNLLLYEPWTIPKEFGTMGTYGYYPSYTEIKKMFSVSQNLNKLKDIVHYSPDPKSYPGCLYYRKKNIIPNTMTEFNVTKVSQLDESYIGKDKFIGDSMMIGDIVHYRKERKKKRRDWLEQRRLEKERLREKIEKDKKDKNKEAIAETQLVNIEAEETLESKVDIKKLQEIRLALRRRYANRTNFRKIFKEWDHSIAGEISVYDVHDMINAFSIPINFNETRALIASSNKRGTETLNMEEFMHLIFNDNQQLKVDLSKIKFKDEKLYEEGAQVENLKKNMTMNILEAFKTDDLNYIKQHLHTRIPMFNNFMKILEVNGENLTKEQLTKVLENFHMPERYTRPNLINAIYETYLTDDKTLFDTKKFIKDCLISEENNFSNFRNKMIELLAKKVENTSKEVKSIEETLKAEKNKRIIINEGYAEGIRLKKLKLQKEQEEIEKNLKEVINPQPNTAFINKVYKEHYKNFQTLNEVEDNFSSKPSILRNFQGKTRFSGNPPHKDTFYLISQDKLGSSFIDEKERFNVRGNQNELVLKEKEQLRLRQLEKLKRIRYYHDKHNEDAHGKMNLCDNEDTRRMIGKTNRLFKYELSNKENNDLVE
jgi:hypothetical protein